MTLKVRIIPCLDVADGRVVKGVNFVDLVDAGDPVEQAKVYDAQGADELTFLDIGASHEGRESIYDVIARTAEVCFMPLTVGGGVRQVEDFRRMLLSGADKVSVNSAAVSDPDLLARAADRFGAQCVVLAIDARMNDAGMFEVFTHGGRKPTGIDAVEWAARAARLGAGEILLTSMDGDGTKTVMIFRLPARLRMRCLSLWWHQAVLVTLKISQRPSHKVMRQRFWLPQYFILDRSRWIRQNQLWKMPVSLCVAAYNSACQIYGRHHYR